MTDRSGRLWRGRRQCSFSSWPGSWLSGVRGAGPWWRVQGPGGGCRARLLTVRARCPGYRPGDEAAWCRAMMGGAGRGCLHHPLCHCLITTNTTQLQPVTRPANTQPSYTDQVQSSQINRRPMIDNALLKIGRGDNPKHRKRHEIGRKPDIFNIEINLLDGTYSNIEHVSSFDSLICWSRELWWMETDSIYNIIQLSADPVEFYFHTSNCRSRSRYQIVPKFWHFWQSYWILWMSLLLAPCPFYIPTKYASSMYCNLLHTSYMSDLNNSHLVRIFRADILSKQHLCKTCPHYSIF